MLNPTWLMIFVKRRSIYCHRCMTLAGGLYWSRRSLYLRKVCRCLSLDHYLATIHSILCRSSLDSLHILLSVWWKEHHSRLEGRAIDINREDFIYMCTDFCTCRRTAASVPTALWSNTAPWPPSICAHSIFGFPVPDPSIGGLHTITSIRFSLSEAF